MPDALNEWLKTKMKILVRESGLDTDGKFVESNKWIKKFKKRKGLSVQKRTNKKTQVFKKGSLKLKIFTGGPYTKCKVPLFIPGVWGKVGLPPSNFEKSLKEFSKDFFNFFFFMIFVNYLKKRGSPPIPPPSILKNSLRNLVWRF